MISAVFYVAHDSFNTLGFIAFTVVLLLTVFHFSMPFLSLSCVLARKQIMSARLLFHEERILFKNSAFKGRMERFMSVYAIADLHLSTLESTNKSMEVFGRRWSDYMTRISENWKRLVTNDDTVIIPGDISWALSLEEATSDLKFLDSLPGKKILGKGNHDFWWSTMNKHYGMFEKNGITTISFLFNNAVELENLIVSGTRGWYNDEDMTNIPDNTDFDKLTAREALRLKMSLDCAMRIKENAPEKEIVSFMHFPPFWNGKASNGLIDLLIECGVKRVYFGHIHGNYTIPSKFDYSGIEMSLISADYLNFIPKFII